MARLAAFIAQFRHGPTLWLAGLSAGAYATIALQPPSASVAALCSRAGAVGLAALTSLELPSPGLPTMGAVLPGSVFTGSVATGSAGVVQQTLPLQAFAADWILMVVAMMSPLVGGSLAYVARSVHRSQKAPATLAFLLGYLAIWILSGLVLVLAALVLSLAAGGAAWVAALVIALVWTMSPLAQQARNDSHRCARIGAFGLNAQADSCWLGLRNGLACLLACWPVMIVPLLVASGHVPVMILAGLVLFADKLAPPAPAQWRLPPFVETLLGAALIRQRPFSRIS